MPVVADKVVYFPSWNGYLYGPNAFDGSLIWKQNLSELTGLKGTGTIANMTVSRSAPTITGKLLIVPVYGPVVVIAMNQSNGRPVCLVKLNILSGAILWQTYTLPDNGGERGGYAGAAIRGSSPAIDPERRLAYVATGNLYTAPPEVEECQERQNNQTTQPTEPDQCIGPDVNFSSIIAFEMESGRISWRDLVAAEGEAYEARPQTAKGSTLTLPTATEITSPLLPRPE
ncbi:hypothetical protein NL676_037608 [Syzygium grande]|nr:hypothetical protein NL676_037608 [Syzygium grande]